MSTITMYAIKMKDGSYFTEFCGLHTKRIKSLNLGEVSHGAIAIYSKEEAEQAVKELASLLWEVDKLVPITLEV